MTTQKRRVIYMTDQEWARAQAWAEVHDLSTSALIRASLAGLGPIDAVDGLVPKRVRAQAQRDAILRRINK